MDWTQIKYFRKNEFVDNADLAAGSLIRNLDRGRELIGKRMFPSPVRGTLCRYGGSETSQHYVGPEPGMEIRKSTGADMFIEGRPIEHFLTFLGSGLFKGVGLYLDTKMHGYCWIMTHLDIRDRKQPLVWIAYKKDGKTLYVYPHQAEFYMLLRDPRLYQEYFS